MGCQTDRIFTSSSWTELFKLLHTKLQLSSTYHPQTDGQTERINQCVEMFLCCLVHSAPKQWVKWLSLAEFWCNSSFHSSLGCSPSKALYGFDASPEAVPLLAESSNFDVQAMLMEKHMFSEMIKEQLARAQSRMKHFANIQSRMTRWNTKRS